MKTFGEQLVGKRVTLIFGNGIFAVNGTVEAVHADYLVLIPHDSMLSPHYVPLAAIVFAKVHD